MAAELAPWEMDRDILQFKQERQARAGANLNVERPRLQQQPPQPQYESARNTYYPPQQYESARNNYNAALGEDYDGSFLSKLGLPSGGGGNPVRSPSGRVVASLRKDPDIYANSSHNLSEMDISNEVMRYQKQQAQPLPANADYYNRSARDSSLDAHNERIQMLENQLENIQNQKTGRLMFPSNESEYDAKFGAGLSFRQSFARINAKPERPESSVVGEDFLSKVIASSRRGGAGAPLRANDGQVQTKLPMTFSKNDRGEVTISDRDAPPWRAVNYYLTRAPLDDEVETVPRRNVYAAYNFHEEALDSSRQRLDVARQHREQTKRLIEEERNRKQRQDREMKFGGGDIATVMAQGQVGHPRRDPITGFLIDHHLPTTDATREKTRTHERRYWTSDYVPYKTMLEKQAEERQLRQQVSREQDIVEARQHHEKVNTMWGHPGGGAPKLDTQKYSDINELLNSPRRQQYEERAPYSNYVPPIPAYMSTHRNGYDYYVPRNEPRIGYGSYGDLIPDS